MLVVLLGCRRPLGSIGLLEVCEIHDGLWIDRELVLCKHLLVRLSYRRQVRLARLQGLVVTEGCVVFLSVRVRCRGDMRLDGMVERRRRELSGAPRVVHRRVGR
jgi:hypothetical protein